MPKVRRMPNGDFVRFGDHYSDWDIEQFILKKFYPQDVDMLKQEPSAHGNDVVDGWYRYLEKSRGPDDPQRQMMLKALQDYNKDLSRRDIPPAPPPKIRTVI